MAVTDYLAKLTYGSQATGNRDEFWDDSLYWVHPTSLLVRNSDRWSNDILVNFAMKSASVSRNLNC